MNEIKQTIKCDGLDTNSFDNTCNEDMTRIVGGNFYNAEGYFCQMFQCGKCKSVKIYQGEYQNSTTGEVSRGELVTGGTHKTKSI